MSGLQIEEGKWYRRRDGAVVGPVVRGDDPPYPFEIIDGNGYKSYTACGIYHIGNPGGQDLVEEVPAPQAIHMISRLLDDVEEVPAPLPQNPVEKYLPSTMTAADMRSEIDRLQSEIDARMRDVKTRSYRVPPSGKGGVEEVPAPLPQNPVDIAIAAEIDAETAATTFGLLGQYASLDSAIRIDVATPADGGEVKTWPYRVLPTGKDGYEIKEVGDHSLDALVTARVFEAAGVPADTLPRRAVDIAGKAASLVGGDRDRQHGAKHDNFRRIAGVWNAWLAIRKEPAAPLDAHDVGCMMALMKLARTQSGALNVDDYVDACGYAACAGEVAQINET